MLLRKSRLDFWAGKCGMFENVKVAWPDKMYQDSIIAMDFTFFLILAFFDNIILQLIFAHYHH
jgi:hypothetical protein